MDPADPTARSGDGGQAGRLSHAERIGLFFHRSFDRWLTPFVIWIMRRTKGALADAWKVDALLLTTRGRRSGRARTVALQFFPDGDAMILTAANDGGAAHPGWSFNLRDEPVARVEVKGQQRDGFVYATRIHINGPETTPTTPEPPETSASIHGILNSIAGTKPALTLTVGTTTVRTSSGTAASSSTTRTSSAIGIT